MASTRSYDPMRTTPAPAVATMPATRVVDLQYNYDWLANMTESTDDASAARGISDRVETNKAANAATPRAHRARLPHTRPECLRDHAMATSVDVEPSRT